MNTTKIVKEVSLEEFKDIISKYKDNIEINPHAFDHLSDAQSVFCGDICHHH